MQIKVKQKSIHNSVCIFFIFYNGISVGSSLWQYESKVNYQQNGGEVLGKLRFWALILLKLIVASQLHLLHVIALLH